MKKAILVLDMPSCCDECPLAGIAHDSELYDEGECYCIPGVESVDLIMVDSKPDWCPLVEMPEKWTDQELAGMQEYEQATAIGYNSCIGEIMLKSEKKDR